MERERFEPRAEGDASAQLTKELEDLTRICKPESIKTSDTDPGEILSIVCSEMPRLIDEANKSDSLAFEQQKKTYVKIVNLRQIVTEHLPRTEQKRLILQAFKDLETKLQS